jgi:predicted GNAT family N-acyltransferase
MRRVFSVDGSTEMQRAYAIRLEVFVREQGVPAEEELDALDAVSLHALVEDDGVAVATGRLIPPDAEHAYAKIGRMAVLRGSRGTGAGRAVMEFLVGEASRCGHRELRLAAQDHALGFYARQGFEVCSGAFLDCGIPHHWMKRVLG